MLLAGPISHTSTQYIDFVDFFTFQWICLPIILLVLVGVELSLRVVVTILECCVTFSGVKLSIKSFVLLLVSEKYGKKAPNVSLYFKFPPYGQGNFSTCLARD